MGKITLNAVGDFLDVFFAAWGNIPPLFIEEIKVLGLADDVFSWISYTEAKTVTFDAAYGALPVPQRSGYVFDGWHTEDMTILSEQSIVRTASDQMLYANWTMLGDVLRDESLDLQDVTLLMRHLAGGWDTTGIHVSAGDVNRDGEVNLKDAVLLRRYLAGGWTVELK